MCLNYQNTKIEPQDLRKWVGSKQQRERETVNKGQRLTVARSEIRGSPRRNWRPKVVERGAGGRVVAVGREERVAVSVPMPPQVVGRVQPVYNCKSYPNRAKCMTRAIQTNWSVHVFSSNRVQLLIWSNASCQPDFNPVGPTSAVQFLKHYFTASSMVHLQLAGSTKVEWSQILLLFQCGTRRLQMHAHRDIIKLDR